MKLIGTILGCLFFQFSSLSQVIKIIASTGEPVPYATIEIPKKKKAFFANAEGSVQLNSETVKAEDTLVISSIGFKTERIVKSSISGTVILEAQAREMPEVFAFPGKLVRRNWGSTGKFDTVGNYSAQMLSGPGDQLGKRIRWKEGIKGIVLIDKVSFLYRNAGKTNVPVRLRIYKIGEDGLPGDDLLTSSVVRQMTSDNGWLDFELGELSIRMPEKGIVVAAEFFNTDSIFWHLDSNWIRPLGKGKFERYTQNVLGGLFIIDDYEKECSSYKRTNGEWIKLDNRWLIKPFWCYNLVVKVWVRYPK